MKIKAWQGLDVKALTAIQLCLANEVLDELSSEKVTLFLSRLQDHYLKKPLVNHLFLKEHVFVLCMHVAGNIHGGFNKLILETG